MNSSASYSSWQHVPSLPSIDLESLALKEFKSRVSEQDIQAVPCMALFSCLSDEELLFVSNQAISRRYEKHTQIISEYDDTTSLYIIQRGKVKVTKRNEAGKEIILAVLKTGDYFGEISLIDGGLRSTNVVSLVYTELLQLRRQDVLSLLSKNSKLALHIMRVLAQRLRTASQKIEGLALTNVYSRILNLFTDMAKPIEGFLQIEDPFTHQDIAEMVGASREMVSRILGDLVKGEYILINKRRIIIKKKLPVAW